jgi:hypothetical protein
MMQLVHLKIVHHVLEKIPKLFFKHLILLNKKPIHHKINFDLFFCFVLDQNNRIFIIIILVIHICSDFFKFEKAVSCFTDKHRNKFIYLLVNKQQDRFMSIDYYKANKMHN